MQCFVVTKKVEEDNGGAKKKTTLMQPQRKKPRLAIFNELGVSKVAALFAE